jgi:2Fe-2S ferredoxin
MATITFKTTAGESILVEDAGGTLMEVATSHNIDGILGSCGGVCSCATCHVHIHPAWVEQVGSASEVEQDLLDLEDNVTPRSRLSCQVEITDALDGLVVEVPND